MRYQPPLRVVLIWAWDSVKSPPSGADTKR